MNLSSSLVSFDTDRGLTAPACDEPYPCINGSFPTFFRTRSPEEFVEVVRSRRAPMAFLEIDQSPELVEAYKSLEEHLPSFGSPVRQTNNLDAVQSARSMLDKHCSGASEKVKNYVAEDVLDRVDLIVSAMTVEPQLSKLVITKDSRQNWHIDELPAKYKDIFTAMYVPNARKGTKIMLGSQTISFDKPGILYFPAHLIKHTPYHGQGVRLMALVHGYRIDESAESPQRDVRKIG
jgi:hypothetical protein